MIESETLSIPSHVMPEACSSGDSQASFPYHNLTQPPRNHRPTGISFFPHRRTPDAAYNIAISNSTCLPLLTPRPVVYHQTSNQTCSQTNTSSPWKRNLHHGEISQK